MIPPIPKIMIKNPAIEIVTPVESGTCPIPPTTPISSVSDVLMIKVKTPVFSISKLSSNEFLFTTTSLILSFDGSITIAVMSYSFPSIVWTAYTP